MERRRRRRRPGASASLLVSVTPALLDRLRRATGPGERSAFVEAAIERALDEGGADGRALRLRLIAEVIEAGVVQLREVAGAI